MPYCTGDAHLGDVDTTYTVEGATGSGQQFTIHHRGQVNALAVLDWVYANLPSPRELFVSGTSAGSMATPFYASMVAQHYPQARVVGLGDDAGMYSHDAATGGDRGPWGLPQVLRRHAGWEQHDRGRGIVGLYVTGARAARNLRLFQVDHAYDGAQRGFIVRSGTKDPDLLTMLRSNQNEIAKDIETFRFFTVGGRDHGVLPYQTFYAYETADHRFRDWVAAIAAGKPVSSVDCRDCSQPGFRFTERDLRIAERALELLSRPGAWNPKDAGGCPQTADRYSLRCAIGQSLRDVIGRPLSMNTREATGIEVRYSAWSRLGDAGPGDALTRYNNHPGNTAADVISLLGEVRDRIRAEVQRRQR